MIQDNPENFCREYVENFCREYVETDLSKFIIKPHSVKLFLTNSVSCVLSLMRGEWRGVHNRRQYIRKFFILSFLQNFYKTAHNLGKTKCSRA